MSKKAKNNLQLLLTKMKNNKNPRKEEGHPKTERDKILSNTKVEILKQKEILNHISKTIQVVEPQQIQMLLQPRNQKLVLIKMVPRKRVLKIRSRIILSWELWRMKNKTSTSNGKIKDSNQSQTKLSNTFLRSWCSTQLYCLFVYWGHQPILLCLALFSPWWWE